MRELISSITPLIIGVAAGLSSCSGTPLYNASHEIEGIGYVPLMLDTDNDGRIDLIKIYLICNNKIEEHPVKVKDYRKGKIEVEESYYRASGGEFDPRFKNIVVVPDEAYAKCFGRRTKS